MADTDRLLEHIQRVVREVSSSVLEALCALLDTIPAAPINRNQVLQTILVPQQRAAVDGLLGCWQHDFAATPPVAIALALRAAAKANQSASQVRTSLVWTGPNATGFGLRRTDQALLELIQSAQQELLLVTFAAYRVPLIVEALKTALARGVRLCFISESTEESLGKVSFDAAKALGPEIAPFASIYVWPARQRTVDDQGHQGALHAKCAIADKSMLLLSSANLTNHALSLNIEMGLLIRGGSLPGQVADVFQILIANNALVPLA